MSTTTIPTGQVLTFTEAPLQIHNDSAHYQSGAWVVPDNANFITVITNSGKYAISSSELHLAYKAKNEQGETVYVHRYECNYVRATDKEGDYVHFTSETAAEAAGFKFSLRKNRWLEKASSEFYGEEKLLSYHTSQSRIDRSKLPSYTKESDEWLMGLEIEKTDYSLQQSGEAWELLQEYGWSKESDGSLSSGGYELVSPVLPVFDWERINAAIAPVKNWIDGRSDSSCGGHITISRKGMKGTELLESMKHIAPLFYALYPNRVDNRYCQAKDWKNYKNADKYSAFYCKDGSNVGGRIEIRIPSRVVNTKTLVWRIKLVQSLLKEIIEESNLNQIAAKVGSPESKLYKLFAEQYSHDDIADKLRLIHKFAIRYGSHKNGISPSVRTRINQTMGVEVFPS